MMKKIVMVMLLPTTLVANAYAGTVSDSLRTTLYYRSGYSLLELSYMDNAAKLETLKQGIRSIGDNPNTVLQHIKILSAESIRTPFLLRRSSCSGDRCHRFRYHR